MTNKIKCNINGYDIEVSKGTSIITKFRDEFEECIYKSVSSSRSLHDQ